MPRNSLQNRELKSQQQVQKRVLKFQLWGWMLFVLSALFFTAASIRIGDVLSLLGSLLFLFACILFLIPLIAIRE